MNATFKFDNQARYLNERELLSKVNSSPCKKDSNVFSLSLSCFLLYDF